MFSLSFPICGVGKQELLIPKKLLDRIVMNGVFLRPLSKQLMLMMTPNEPLLVPSFLRWSRCSIKAGMDPFSGLVNLLPGLA